MDFSDFSISEVLFCFVKIETVTLAIERTMEFSLNGAELSLNSEDLRNH